MRIGIVLPSVPGYSETFFRNKIIGLQQRGHEITLFVKNSAGSDKFICPVKVHPNLSQVTLIRVIQTFSWLFYSIIVAPKSSLKLWKLTKENHFPIVKRIRSIVIASSILPHKLDWLHFGFATPAMEREFIGNAIGAKVAVSFRGFDINQIPLMETNPYSKLWSQVDKVHTISNYLLKQTYQMGLSKKVPALKITPAIDIHEFTPLNPTNYLPKSILLVSRLHWIKGIEYVLQAFSELHKNDLGFSLTIIGDGEDYERLLFAAQQLGLSNAVKFEGKKTKEEIILAMRSHEIFVQYSLQEGFCNAALEAQACGMLCIVSDADGLLENVQDGRTGWIIPKRKPKILAQKILEIINLPQAKKTKIRENARTRIIKEFSLELQEEAFEKFYQE